MKFKVTLSRITKSFAIVECEARNEKEAAILAKMEANRLIDEEGTLFCDAMHKNPRIVAIQILES